MKNVNLIKTSVSVIGVEDRMTSLRLYDYDHGNVISNSGLVACMAEDIETDIQIQQRELNIRRYRMNGEDIFVAMDGDVNMIIDHALQSSEFHQRKYDDAVYAYNGKVLELNVVKDLHKHLQRKYWRDIMIIRKAGFLSRLKYLFCGFPQPK